MHFRLPISGTIFHGITDQVLEEPYHLSPISLQRRKGIMGDTRASFLDRLIQMGECSFKILIESNRAGPLFFCRKAGICK